MTQDAFIYFIKNNKKHNITNNNINLKVGNFMNKSTDMALRVASLDYLGVVAARLRKDYVTSHRKLASIDQMISEIKSAESKDVEDKNNKKVN